MTTVTANPEPQLFTRLRTLPLVDRTTSFLGGVYGFGKAHLPLVGAVEASLLAHASTPTATAALAKADAWTCKQLDRVATAAQPAEAAVANLALHALAVADSLIERLPANPPHPDAAAAAAVPAVKENAAPAASGLGSETRAVLTRLRVVSDKARTRTLGTAGTQLHAAHAYAGNLLAPLGVTVPPLPAVLVAKSAPAPAPLADESKKVPAAVTARLHQRARAAVVEWTTVAVATTTDILRTRSAEWATHAADHVAHIRNTVTTWAVVAPQPHLARAQAWLQAHPAAAQRAAQLAALPPVQYAATWLPTWAFAASAQSAPGAPEAEVLVLTSLSALELDEADEEEELLSSSDSDNGALASNE